MIHPAKPWEGRLAEVEEQRGRKRPPKLRIIVSAPAGKGRPPQRQCPADFDVIFVEIGRLDCESWYRARRTTINRWLEERGKLRLLKLRADFVRHQRLMARQPKPRMPIQVATDSRHVLPEVAQMAAGFLRVIRNGGWMVSVTPQGDWFVGSIRRSAAEMVSIAEAKGFDVAWANLQVMANRKLGDDHARPA
jgi:hypothetical protein